MTEEFSAEISHDCLVSPDVLSEKFKDETVYNQSYTDFAGMKFEPCLQSVVPDKNPGFPVYSCAGLVDDATSISEHSELIKGPHREAWMVDSILDVEGYFVGITNQLAAYFALIEELPHPDVDPVERAKWLEACIRGSLCNEEERRMDVFPQNKSDEIFNIVADDILVDSFFRLR